MRISKRTREDAALICAIKASTPIGLLCGNIAKWLGLKDEAARLASSAERAAWDESEDVTQTEAEAEALLRSGWCPGDRVYLRGVK